uniref:Uncharacterized protein n=1 Tax=uncultured marine virus TaxID=186617 RepID=A0A0F7LBF9_9VIRU|nr:hypothetical protein [uncultured marine virus]
MLYIQFRLSPFALHDAFEHLTSILLFVVYFDIVSPLSLHPTIINSTTLF